MQMRRQTQTNMLVSWITTYHTGPGAQTMLLTEQICIISSLFIAFVFSVLPCLFVQSIILLKQLSRPLSDSGQFNAHTAVETNVF